MSLLVRRTLQLNQARLRLCPRSNSTASTGPKSSLKLFRNVAILSGISLAAYTLGAIYPPTPLKYFANIPPPPPPLPPDSLEIRAFTDALEDALQSIPLLSDLRAAPDANEWYEARPYQEPIPHSLTAGSLRGPGKLALPPLVRARWDEQESIVFVHVGHRLCGHKSIVHGGLLATLFDEILARTAINNLPGKIGVTASLKVNYRAPTFAHTFIIFRTRLISKNGRKAVVDGTVESLDGTVLADASALYVEPKYAPIFLDTEAIKHAMGLPQPSPPPSTVSLVSESQSLS